ERAADGLDAVLRRVGTTFVRVVLGCGDLSPRNTTHRADEHGQSGGHHADRSRPRGAGTGARLPANSHCVAPLLRASRPLVATCVRPMTNSGDSDQVGSGATSVKSPVITRG